MTKENTEVLLPEDWRECVINELNAAIGSLEFVKNHIENLNLGCRYCASDDYCVKFDKKLVKAIEAIDKLEIKATRC